MYASQKINSNILHIRHVVTLENATQHAIHTRHIIISWNSSLSLNLKYTILINRPSIHLSSVYVLFLNFTDALGINDHQ